jgi:CubicO group peptidase (beta-lactamase class C family)
MAVATRPEIAEGTRVDVPQLKGFDDFVRRLMRDWKVQGLGVAVARDGELVYSRGFGLRDVAHDLPVTPHTIFPIGSTTKTFTTASLALLADDGLLDWDTPVRRYLPDFKLWDGFASDRMTPRDLSCHRSGLPRHDLMWYGSDQTREEIFRRLQHLRPNADFRTVWQYQNLMYMTAGHLVGVLSGSTWEDFVQKRILEPLGMATTKVNSAAVENSPDFSRGYRKKKSEVVEMPFYAQFDAVAPAGSIVSSVTDMSQWLLMHLNEGKLGDQRFLSEGQVRLMHTPQTFIARGRFAEMPYSSYGLGWFVEPYRGHDMIHHGGNIDGFSSMFSLMPQDGIGVVVLTNMDGTPVRGIIPYNVFDRFIDGKQIAWNARAKADHKEVESGGKRGKEKHRGDRVSRTRPSHKLDAYIGSYEHPGYGTVRIDMDGKDLKATYNNIEFVMRHYHYDTFEMRFERFDITMLGSFSTDKRGSVGGLAVPFEPSVEDIVFTRAAEKTMTDRSFLKPFAGSYEVMGSMLVVELKGDLLHVSVPGLPEYELVPIKGTEFGLKGLSGFSIEFKRDDSGAVAEALVNEMGTVLIAKKR